MIRSDELTFLQGRRFDLLLASERDQCAQRVQNPSDADRINGQETPLNQRLERQGPLPHCQKLSTSLNCSTILPVNFFKIP